MEIMVTCQNRKLRTPKAFTENSLLSLDHDKMAAGPTCCLELKEF